MTAISIRNIIQMTRFNEKLQEFMQTV